MEKNPVAEQMETVNAFGKAAAKGLQSVGSKMPKRVDTSRWDSLSSSLSKPGGAGSSGQPVTDLRKLGPITTRYGGSTNYEDMHPGVDVAMPIGQPLPALREGTVVDVVTGRKAGEKKSYGNRVGIKDAEGNTWYYSHLDRAWVQIGQKVKAGDHIGTAGNTGSTYSRSGGTGSHLDLRIVDAYGKFQNPAYFGIKY